MSLYLLLMMKNNSKILITGGNGMVGKALTEWLLDTGYQVNVLQRRSANRKNEYVERVGLNNFYWDVEAGELDTDCLHDVSVIVHLAGASIGAGRWTAARKRAIIDSRVNSINLVFSALSAKKEHKVHTVISASATGYYKTHNDRVLVEESPSSDGFLGETCKAWESAVTQGCERLEIRSVLMRSGVILDREEGIYAQLRGMAQSGLGVIPGSGKQWLPWIHIEDAVRAYTWAVENKGLRGPYNMVSPEAVTLGQFMRALAASLKKKIWLPPIPAFFVRLGMGQMSALVLDSMNVSPSKLMMTGFDFNYANLTDAIHELEDE